MTDHLLWLLLRILLLHCLPLLLYCLPFVVDGFDELLWGVVPHLVVTTDNDLVALSQEEIRNIIVRKMVLFEVVDLVVFNLSEQSPLLKKYLRVKKIIIDVLTNSLRLDWAEIFLRMSCLKNISQQLKIFNNLTIWSLLLGSPTSKVFCQIS